MGHTVIVKVGRSCEPFAADGTFVRFLPAVDPPVRVERTGRRETFAANIAHVRFFTCRRQIIKFRADFISRIQRRGQTRNSHRPEGLFTPK